MRKIIKKFLLVSILFCTVFSFSIETIGAVDNDKFDVRIDVGYNNNYKIGFSTPINVTIKNNYKDINGEVEIQVPSTPGKYMSYVKPISLQKDAEKVITINVPVGMNRPIYSLNIYNGKDKVYEENIRIGMAANDVTSFIGILSDDFDSLSYINKVPATAGVSLVTRTIKLDEKSFPEDIFTLNAFNIIVINDYDTSRYSKLQYDILKQWVNNGGTLLLGTGSKYNKTLSVFKDDFIMGTQGSVKGITTSKIYELATNGDSKNDAQVDTLSLSIKDSKVLIEDKDVILAQSLKKGKGVVGIVAFDLGQAPFANWNNNTAFMEKLLGIINPEMTTSRNNTDYLQNNLYMINNSMNQFSEMATAKTSSFYLILFIYVLVVAPLSYIILKKMDKRELMWITVPVLAIIFGLIVFISGSGTRLSEITTNMISFLNIDEKGNASTDTYAGIFNSNKMKVNIVGKNGEKILPLSNNNYYSNSNQTIDNEVMEVKIFAVPNGGIEYRNSSLLETKVLQIQDSSKNIGKIETNLTIKNRSIIGDIKNSTNLDLVDCMIIMPEGYYKIDNLKSGETAKLDGRIIVNNSGNIHQMIQNVFFSNNINTSNMTEAERKSHMDKSQEGSILQMMFNNGNGQTEGVNFIGFSKTAIHNPLIINGKEAKKYERNVLYFPIELNFTNGETIDYPFGFVPFDITNTSNLNYDMDNKIFYGKGYADIIYKLDPNMIVDEIEINTSNTNIKTSANGKSYNIFNIDQKSYEPFSNGVIKGTDLKKYVSLDNTIIIRLELNDTDGVVPKMAAKGRKE